MNDAPVMRPLAEPLRDGIGLRILRVGEDFDLGGVVLHQDWLDEMSHRVQPKIRRHVADPQAPFGIGDVGMGFDRRGRQRRGPGAVLLQEPGRRGVRQVVEGQQHVALGALPVGLPANRLPVVADRLAEQALLDQRRRQAVVRLDVVGLAGGAPPGSKRPTRPADRAWPPPAPGCGGSPAAWHPGRRPGAGRGGPPPSGRRPPAHCRGSASKRTSWGAACSAGRSRAAASAGRPRRCKSWPRLTRASVKPGRACRAAE